MVVRDVADLFVDKYPDIKWLDDVEVHDYEAAASFLSLMFNAGQTAATVDALRRSGTVVQYFAKDIIRASTLPLLGADNVHVAKDLMKIKAGHKLSPILLVRGRPLTVADGYHRVCAAHIVNENSTVPCRIAVLTEPTMANLRGGY